MGFCGDQWESFWQGVESGSFRAYARGFAVINLLLMISIPFITLVTANILPFLTFILLVILGFLMALIELPYCCSCCEWCEKLKALLEVFENYVLRGFIYIAFGTVLISVSHREDKHAAGWAFGLALPINGILYWIASCQGETEREGEKKDEASDPEAPPAPPAPPAQNTMTSSGNEAGSALQNAAAGAAMEAAKNPAVQKAAIDAVKENPGIALAAARAAARV
eukprot:3506664-Rhodomonas_salina.4